jgi:hypothetical protein
MNLIGMKLVMAGLEKHIAVQSVKQQLKRLVVVHT